MNLLRLVIASLISFVLAAPIYATSNYKTTSVNGTECYIYYVLQGEGFYSVSKKFGVTRDDIIKYNPTANKGLKKGQKLYVPILDKQVTQAKSQKNTVNKLPLIHVVKNGESLFSISKKYNTTINDIKEFNNLKSNSIRVDQNLIVGFTEIGIEDKTETSKSPTPANDVTSNATEEKSNSNVITDNRVIIDGESYLTEKYVVKRRETLYSISQKFGTTVDAILACNPNIKTLAKDDILNIPMTKEVLNVVDEYKSENKSLLSNGSANYSTSNSSSKINIAVILPFKAENPNNQSQLYIDYYKGILLALDSLKNNGLNANVYTFDTNGDVSVVGDILKKPEMKDVDIIFGSDKSEDIKLLGEFAKANNIYLVNSFSVKNKDYETNKHILQGHIPSSMFFAAACNHFVSSTNDKEVIFLIDNNEPNDKEEFTNAIATGVKLNNKEYKKFSFNEVTDFEVLSESLTDNTDIVLVASSSSRSGVAKTCAIATRIKDSRPSINVSIFGYPEWLTYIKDYLETFHSLNTTIFTRFYSEPTKAKWKNFNKKFNYWFGDEKSTILPSPHILGFDTGIYLIGGMLRHGDNFEQYLETIASESIQTDFSFDRVSNQSGFVNKNLYFVTYTPDYKIIKERIK